MVLGPKKKEKEGTSNALWGMEIDVLKMRIIRIRLH
jgi:hypothetical protein